jgi:hypothetical protein
MPVLIDITQEEFEECGELIWETIGIYNSIEVPEEGIPTIIPRIIKGLKWWGINPKMEYPISLPNLTTTSQINWDELLKKLPEELKRQLGVHVRSQLPTEEDDYQEIE